MRRIPWRKASGRKCLGVFACWKGATVKAERVAGENGGQSVRNTVGSALFLLHWVFSVTFSTPAFDCDSDVPLPQEHGWQLGVSQMS